MSKRRKWIGRIVAIVLLPPAFWVLFVSFAPTGWARSRLERRIERETGRVATLGGLELGLLGDVRLRDLRIHERKESLEPCFQIEELRLNLHLVQLLTGESGATEVSADGVKMRIIRDADGELNVADLLNPKPEVATEAQQAGADRCNGLTIRIARSELLVVDEPTRTRLEFRGVEGEGLWTREATTISRLTGLLNEGDFRFEGRYDRSGREPRFEGQISARDVSLGLGMEILTYVVPILPDAEATMGGRLGLDLELRARGHDGEAIVNSLNGLGSLTLDPVHLQGSEVLESFCKLVRIPPESRNGSFQTDFGIRDRRFYTQDTVLTVSRNPIRFSGWTDFDGNVDYRIESEALISRLSPEAQDLLSDLPLKLDDLMGIYVRGNVGNLKLTVEADRASSTKGEEPVKLKRLGQKLLDKLRR